MMYQKKSNRKWKYLIGFSLILTLILLINACDSSMDSTKENDTTRTSNIKTPPPANKTENRESGNNKTQIFQIVDEMPRFPGCENDISLSMEDKSICSNKKLYKYIYRKLKYPEQAVNEGIEGKVIVKFIIDKSGNLKNIVKLHDIGAGCGDAIVEILEGMKDVKWIPGKQRGEKVNVSYTLPVVFKLNSNTK